MGDQPLDAVTDGCPARAGTALGDWIRLLRIPHWIKNAIVFPALLLAGQAHAGVAWHQALWVFAAFCLASSGVYALNDVLDQGTDRVHPSKCRRPLAAGRLQSGAVCWAAVLLAGAGLVFASLAQTPALLCVGSYLVLNAAYSLFLKHVPIVDACCVAAGFVLRVVAVTGMTAAAPVGGLLPASVFCLCFFVALAKRAADLRALAAATPGGRAALRVDGYTGARLLGLLWVGAAVTLGLYATLAGVAAAARPLLWLTVLPVAYSLVRLVRLSTAGAYTEQVGLLRSDRRLVAATALWLALWIWGVLG